MELKPSMLCFGTKDQFLYWVCSKVSEHLGLKWSFEVERRSQVERTEVYLTVSRNLSSPTWGLHSSCETRWWLYHDKDLRWTVGAVWSWTDVKPAQTQTRPDQTRPDQTRPDQTGPDQTGPVPSARNRTSTRLCLVYCRTCSTRSRLSVTFLRRASSNLVNFFLLFFSAYFNLSGINISSALTRRRLVVSFVF